MDNVKRLAMDLYETMSTNEIVEYLSDHGISYELSREYKYPYTEFHLLCVKAAYMALYDKDFLEEMEAA